MGTQPGMTCPGAATAAWGSGLLCIVSPELTTLRSPSPSQVSVKTFATSVNNIMVYTNNLLQLPTLLYSAQAKLHDTNNVVQLFALHSIKRGHAQKVKTAFLNCITRGHTQKHTTFPCSHLMIASNSIQAHYVELHWVLGCSACCHWFRHLSLHHQLH